MAKTVRPASPKGASPKIAYALTIGRPVAGGALFAHTLAFLDASGMLGEGFQPGAPVGVATVRKAMGDTALSYHLKKGTLERTDNGIALTPGGAMHFAGTRGATNIELIGEFKNMFATGKLGARLGAILPKGATVQAIA